MKPCAILTNNCVPTLTFTSPYIYLHNHTKQYTTATKSKAAYAGEIEKKT